MRIRLSAADAMFLLGYLSGMVEVVEEELVEAKAADPYWEGSVEDLSSEIASMRRIILALEMVGVRRDDNRE